MRFIQALSFGLLIFLSTNTFAGTAEDASAVIDRWAAAMSERDTQAIQKLYMPDALLHGISSPKLYAGSTAVRDYFKTAPESGKKVTISERNMVVLAHTAVMGIGFYQFDLIQDGIRVPRSARFTFVMVKRRSNWLIAHHHSSTLPPAPLQ